MPRAKPYQRNNWEETVGSLMQAKHFSDEEIADCYKTLPNPILSQAKLGEYLEAIFKQNMLAVLINVPTPNQVGLMVKDLQKSLAKNQPMKNPSQFLDVNLIWHYHALQAAEGKEIGFDKAANDLKDMKINHPEKFQEFVQDYQNNLQSVNSRKLGTGNRLNGFVLALCFVYEYATGQTAYCKGPASHHVIDNMPTELADFINTISKLFNLHTQNLTRNSNTKEFEVLREDRLVKDEYVPDDQHLTNRFYKLFKEPIWQKRHEYHVPHKELYSLCASYKFCS